MTARDFSNVGWCDHCADTDAFLVGTDENGNYCDKCDPADVYQPEPKPQILWGLIALIAFVSIVVAPWLRD